MSVNETVTSQNRLSFLRIFFYRKWFIITPLYAGLVIGGIVAFLMPPEYESSTLILVEEQKTINPLIQNLAVSSDVVQRLQTIREQLLGWNSLVSILHKLKMDSNVQSQQQMEDLVAGVRERITVDLTMKDIVRLSFTSDDPQQALDVVKSLSDLFIQANMRVITKETDMAIEFLKQQLEVYKRKIKESEIATMEEQVNSLKLDATEEHPMVRDLRSRIALARRQLESGDYKLDQDNEKAARYRELMRRELDRVAGDGQQGQRQDDANESIYKLFLMDRLDLSVARDIEVNRQIYNMLLQRLETAKITQRLESSKQGTRYTVIDPPRLPLKPSAPNRLFIVMSGMLLGGSAGVGMVFARQFADQSFLDIEEARKSLEYPVLGAVSRITTMAEIEREKDKRIIMVIIVVILSATLVVGTGMFTLFK